MELSVCNVANYAPIKKLKFHPKNQEMRTISRERLDDLKESIKQKGFYEPLLVLKKKGPGGPTILAGEHRTRAALELIDEGFEFMTSEGKKNQLPIVIEDCDEETALQILHESNNHYAVWIDKKVRAELKAAEEAGQDLRQFGYSQDDIDKMLVAALKDTEEILDAEDEDLDDTSGVRTDDESIEKDRFESLVLPRDVYQELMGILGQIARSTDPEWTEGDSVVEATKSLCEAIKAAKILE